MSANAQHLELKTTTAARAAVLLADLIRHDFGHDVSPAAVRRFLDRRWARISPLAHVIHREGGGYQADQLSTVDVCDGLLPAGTLA